MKQKFNQFIGSAWGHLRIASFRRPLASVLILAALPIQAALRQELHGHLPAAMKNLKAAGKLSGTNQLNLAIALPLRNQAELSTLLRQMYDPASTNYHHYLTPAQFTERFGPSQADYAAVVAFAKASGLKVTATHPNRVLLDVRGTAASVERALHVTFHTYQHPLEKRTFYAPDTEPSLDLGVPILHISGLDNFSLPRPHVKVSSLFNGQNATANAGSGANGTYMGNDFRAAYLPGTTLNGSGQAVGLLQFDGYTASDIIYYENAAGLPHVPLQNVLIDGASGFPSHTGGEVEVSLDIEMAISMATNLSKVILYIAPNPSPFVDILSRMANDNQAKQLSCSWYVPSGPAEPAADVIFQQMAAQGQSFFNASGDDDAYSGLISFPGDSPYITQVGGTTLTTTGPGGAWAAETVWNWNNGVGSAGGISTQYPIPSWQTNISMTANQGSTTWRNTPDVALTADNIYVRADGLNYNVGGTSASAPLWAGFAALVNQQAAGSGKPAIGFINPVLDVIGKSANYTVGFHDIITGNNTRPGSTTQFYAAAGYDLCTGWGTPAGQNLINTLANPEPLTVTPLTGFTATGGMGGPFTVTSQTYTLTNSGTNTLMWSLANTSPWLTATASGGTLTPGGPSATVAVSLNMIASNLVVGTYSAGVGFTNLNDNFGQNVQFSLAIISPPSITQQPEDETALEGSTAIFSAQAAGGLPLAFQWQFNGTNLLDGGNIFGATTTNLVINLVTAANVGMYSLVVTNYANQVVSSNATLTLTPSAPMIVLQPKDQTVYVNSSAQFSVGVIGTTPYSYQWSCNGTNLANATNAILSLFNVQLTDAGSYSVLVTNLYGLTNSATATLTVNPLPPCDPVPAGIVAWWAAESNALDSVANNNGTLMNGTGFAAGEVGTAFNLTGANTYVLANPASPGNLDVGLGSGFTFECWINPTTTGTQMPVFEYEGSLGGSDIGPFLYINLPPGGGNGPGCLMANINDTSRNSHEFASAGNLVAAAVWQHVALTYDKTAGVAIIYLNGTNVAQANLGSITPQTSYANLLLGARTYSGSAGSPSDKFSGQLDECSLYNRALSANEITAIYLAGSLGKCFTPTPPVINTQPTNQTVQVGGTAAFAVLAGGTAPLSYQWSCNGTNLPTATNAILSLFNVQFTNAGNYTVLVSNPYGFTNSAAAGLTVYALPPVITNQPANQIVFVGSTATFSVVAGGTAPLSYQWSCNGTNLANATNAILSLFNVQLTDAGSYSVLVTNLYGLTNSATATLTVNPLPPCDPVPAGIVAWWAAESNALDSVANNNGTLMNGTGFAAGEVGTAFNLTGANTYVLANPASPGNLDVGLGSGFTFECWINPTTTGTQMPVFEYEGSLGGSDIGPFLYINLPPGGGNGPGCLMANINDTSRNSHEFASAGNLVAAAVWQHVALTYDKTAGVAIIYLNGTNVAQANLGSITPQTSYANLLLGARTYSGSAGSPSDKFSGQLDECSLYNRALSANEITAIYLAGSLGKCFTPTPPVINTQPTNQTVQVGGTAAFAVLAGGTAPLSYQWSCNGTNLPTATNAILSLFNVQFTNAGNYTVLVSNPYGFTNSAAAGLTVYALPPVITNQPANQIVFVGSTATFSVVAGGTAPLSYQWSCNGTNLANATNAILSLFNVQLTDAGSYSVLVTNLYGLTNSATATLTVNPLPPCDPVPSGIVAWWAAESNALDSVANNNGTLMNGTGFAAGEVGTAFNLNGANNYVVGNLNVRLDTGFTFECWIKPTTTSSQMPIFEYERVLGSRTGSDIGSLFYINLPPSSGNGPGSIMTDLVDTNLTGHTFASPGNLVVAGVWQHLALTYDKASGVVSMYLNGTNVAQSNLGSFTPQTTFTNLLLGARTYFGSAGSPSDKFSGQLDECSLYNRALSANEIATIYLAGNLGKCPLPPTIFTQPTNASVNVGATTTFQVVAGGTPPLKYQWGYNGTNLLNATNATLSLGNVQLTNAGNYSVMVLNNSGVTNSTNAVLVVRVAPTITAQPTNQTVNAGDSTSFSATVAGTPLLNFQWQFNGTNLSGATNLVLALDNVQLTDGGGYSLRVTNNFGAVTSSIATLTVQAPPALLAQPTNLTVNVGDTAVFAVTAAGSAPLSYHWSLNGPDNPISGGTNASLIISNAQLANAGVYVLTVTNQFGGETSSNATLTVIDVLDHFTWNPIPSPRFVNAPFAVTIQARDSINQLFTNFAGTVLLTSTNGIPVSPGASGGFNQGSWSGPVTINQAVSNLVLRASDGAGHAAQANAIMVVAPPSLSMQKSSGSLLLFWPIDPAGFMLETSGTLDQWVPVSIPPFQIGNQYLESIQLDATNQFYRLRFTLP